MQRQAELEAAKLAAAANESSDAENDGETAALDIEKPGSATNKGSSLSLKAIAEGKHVPEEPVETRENKSPKHVVKADAARAATPTDTKTSVNNTKTSVKISTSATEPTPPAQEVQKSDTNSKSVSHGPFVIPTVSVSDTSNKLTPFSTPKKSPMKRPTTAHGQFLKTSALRDDSVTINRQDEEVLEVTELDESTDNLRREITALTVGLSPFFNFALHYVQLHYLIQLNAIYCTMLSYTIWFNLMPSTTLCSVR